ncbi:MAG: hypothetical protein FWF08_00955 [Oscillospiraceae bacterium]|nr:hypothetical protein [Oscillospiraceae bacterium]
MSENNGNALQKLEDVINEVFSGDTLKNALDFTAFLRANEMIYRKSHGEISYNGNCVCYMHLDGLAQKPGPWTIWTEGDYSGEREDFPMDEHMKEIAWANVNICASCGGSCSPGKRTTIFGKEFDNVCSAAMAFYIPDTETLECVKKLLEIRKKEINLCRTAIKSSKQ